MNQTRTAGTALALAAFFATSARAEDVWIKRNVQAHSATSPAAEAVASFNKGAKVTVLEKQGAWSKVSLNGTTGWVATESLSARQVNPDAVALGQSKTDVQNSAGAAFKPVGDLAKGYATANHLDPNVVDVQLPAIKKSVTAPMLERFMADGKVGTAHATAAAAPNGQPK